MSQAFSVTIPSEQLKRGLRPSRRAPRNAGFLVECDGAVGKDGVLACLDDITKLYTFMPDITINETFPFPQIFAFINVVIVCDQSRICEYNNGIFEIKYTADSVGGLWSAVDFFDFIYLSNGVEAVVRDAGSKVYSLTTDLPTATAMCNYNGQVLIGAPDVSGLGADLLISVEPMTITLDLQGDL